jgi:acyl carrier protein
METKEFIEKFAAQFEETHTINFTLETKFRELDEWSSLIALSIIAMVDVEYGIKLKGDEIRQSQTIGDIYNILITKN